eukprot:TRINITY_DN30455_c0_g1_i1.p1 TRINITY_DN30455_c0_g1~~TRINITY_DN30455_c0_g1_i1.p1  ORF type:complete len:568 (+),score=165.60 TRINITY_DN30455_c0_g1_i1:106-1809(+)
MPFNNAQRALETLLPYAPEMEVITDEVHLSCAGIYTVQNTGEVNGYPFWLCEPSGMWLYSTPNGYWRVTDDTGDFAEGKGYIVSKDRHNGVPPDALEMYCVGGREVPAIKIRPWVRPDYNAAAELQTADFSSPHAQHLYAPFADYDGAGTVGGYDTSPSPPGPGLAGPDLGTYGTLKPVEVQIQKHPNEKLGLVFRAGGPMELTKVTAGCAGDRNGMGQYLQWNLTHVNGNVVLTIQELLQYTTGQSVCYMRMVPPVLAEGLARPGWEGRDERVYVSKGANEPLGLQLEGLVLVGVAHGSPAHRHGIATLLGRELCHIDGETVSNLHEVTDRLRNKEGIELGFLIPDEVVDPHVAAAQDPQRQLPPPALRNTPDDPVVIVPVTRTQGSMGCWFADKPSLYGGLILKHVEEGSTAFTAGLGRLLGRSLVAINDQPILSPDTVAKVWRRTPVGRVLVMRLEIQPDAEGNYPDALYDAGPQPAVPNAPNPLNPNASAQPPPPEGSFAAWQERRAQQRYEAASPGAVLAARPRDGDYNRRTLGLRAGAGQPKHLDPVASQERPTFLGPGKT